VRALLVQVGERQQQLACCVQTLLHHHLVEITNDHLIQSFDAGLPRFTEAELMPRQRLQLQRHMFQDVRRIGPTIQPLKEPATLAHTATVVNHAWQPAFQPLIKTWHLIRSRILQAS
jgi:hypothetical protein